MKDLKHAAVGYLAVILATFIVVLYFVPIITIWSLIGLVTAFLVVVGVVLKYFKK